MATKTVKEENMTLKIATYDAVTGEYSDREMNAEELLEHEARIAEEVARVTTVQAKAIAKAAVLERLGITAEEAVLLLS
jgi:hypothetical protein